MVDFDAHLDRLERKHNSFSDDTLTNEEIDKVLKIVEEALVDFEPYIMDQLSDYQQQIYKDTFYVSVNEYNNGGRK